MSHDIKLAKIVQDKLAINDVQWTSVNTFQVWLYEQYDETDGTLTADIKVHEYEIKEI